MEKYKYWEILKEMPEGWRIDKNSGSPLYGHEFITNGKSPINGQKRALLKIKKDIIVNNSPQNEINIENMTHKKIRKDVKKIKKDGLLTHRLARR